MNAILVEPGKKAILIHVGFSFGESVNPPSLLSFHTRDLVRFIDPSVFRLLNHYVMDPRSQMTRPSAET